MNTDSDMPTIALATWTTAYMNKLPDSAFLYIAPGGEKDADGMTKPRSLRYFPYRDEKGQIDLPHLRNAIAQMPKAKGEGLDPSKVASLQAKARKLLDNATKDLEESDEEYKFKETDQEKRSREQKSMEKAISRSQDPEFKKKNSGSSKTGRGGMGNPTTNRYYAESRACAPMALGENDTKWVEIARSGDHFGRGSDRRVSLSVDDIHSMVAGYAKIMSEGWFTTGAPIGYNHAVIAGAVDPDSTKAAGRIMNVQARDNDQGGISLWGEVRWTDEARQRIRAGEFDGFSIEAIPESLARSKKNGKPLGHWALVGGTLTNEPFVSGMSAVAASENNLQNRADQPERTRRMENFLMRLAEATGLPTEAPELLAEIRHLQVKAEKVDTLTEALSTTTADLETLRSRNDHLEDREKMRVLDEACSQGRIAPSERDSYWRILGTVGEEEGHRIFAEGRIPVGTKSADVKTTQQADSVDTEERFTQFVETKISEGMSEMAAWQAASVALGSTLYNNPVEDL